MLGSNKERTTDEIYHVWSQTNTIKIARTIWDCHLETLNEHGFKHAYKRIDNKTKRKIASLTPSGHEVVNAIRAYVVHTGYGNIHAGLTSSDIVDNVRLFQCAQSLTEINQLISSFTDALTKQLSCKIRCVGYTHWQPASWLYWMDRVHAWVQPLSMLSWWSMVTLKPMRGATGTNIAHETLLRDADERVDVGWITLKKATQRLKTQYIGMPHQVGIQSSDHHSELNCAHHLSATAGQLHKIATDIRFLVGTGELILERPVSYRGSSAMPGKVNPFELETVCAACRMVPQAHQVIWETLAHNGLERTLDTSAAMKDTLPRMFGLVGYALKKATGAIQHLVIDKTECNRRLNKKAVWSEYTMASEIAKGTKTRIEVYEQGGIV
jgi:adenylosuccinate lyase